MKPPCQSLSVCHFTLLCAIFFLDPIFLKKWFFFHPSLYSKKPQITSTVWLLKLNSATVRIPNALRRAHHIQQNNRRMGRKKSTKGTESYPPYSQHPREPAGWALAEATAWLQMSPRARNRAMTFLLRLTAPKTLQEGSPLGKQERWLPCVTKSLPVPSKKRPVHLGTVQLFSLSVSWWWQISEILVSRAFQPTQQQSNVRWLVLMTWHLVAFHPLEVSVEGNYLVI